uniref:Reverse transcriptase domain-containing protein n=1 Tax=Tanacetum cinerariifolium TaxID=118510 RepID=A0A699JPW6_TANCI|nr:reverse transcriptase domain-containing protein [Tanacetum cinerariifolium]
MIKELDNICQEKVTPCKLFIEESGGAEPENSQTSPSAEEAGGYSSDGYFRSRSRGNARSARKNRKSVSKKKGISKSHQSVRSEARSRSKSKSAKSKPQSVRASRGKSSSDSGYNTVSESGSEDFSMPYRQPKPMPFTTRITRFRYHRRAKLPPNVSVYEGNKDPKDHLSIFSATAEQEEGPMPVWYDKDPTEIHGIKQKPNEGLQAFMDHFKAESANIKEVPLVLRISAFMHGHGHPELAKNINDKIPKTVDEIMGNCAPYARREGFTPLTKTLKEILAMDNANFPPLPLMVGTPKKQNMNKFCYYHQGRGKAAKRARAQPKERKGYQHGEIPRIPEEALREG